MSVTFTTNGKSTKPSLVVCAGTITCKTVEEMGAGFNLFKTLFSNNVHATDPSSGWKESLQTSLDNFHENKWPIFPYVRLAKQDEMFGGVATAPNYLSKRGLNVTQHDVKDEELVHQYKSAITGAVLDAKKLNLPLFIQPLGIGVYGWPPERAAQLFFDAIADADPTGAVEITIPLFDSSPGSNDTLFAQAYNKLRPKDDYLQQLKFMIDILVQSIVARNGINSNKVKQLQALKTANIDEPQVLIDQLRATCKIKRHGWNFFKTPESVAEFEGLLLNYDGNSHTISHDPHL